MPASSGQGGQTTGPAEAAGFLARLDTELRAGQISPTEALVLRLRYGLAPTTLPAAYQPAAFSPLPCATTTIDEYQHLRRVLPATVVSLVDSWLKTPGDKSFYISPAGHFKLAYLTSGGDAVPATDVAPANGIPDYVEATARHLERAWAVTVDSLGFAAPPAVAGYPVTFKSMQYYGYTVAGDPLSGTTGIVMHNNYQGFPANNDPAGNAIGANKVTAAHEFQHAVQYAGSRWSEGGWVELDATWMEDVVFDQVNDFYNYLPGESPLRHPEIPLDGGSVATGSYEDCVWQTWMSETWGRIVIRDFWQRRAVRPWERVIDSYGALFNARGITFAAAWADFTAWNYGVGTRSVPGVGYTEGAAFAQGQAALLLTSYPAVASGITEHLAASPVALGGFSAFSTDRLHLVLNGEPGAGPLTLAAHIVKRDGTGLIEVLAVNGANQADTFLSVPVREILSAAVIVGNAATSGPAATWSLQGDLVPLAAVAAATTDRADITVVLASGQTTQQYVRLTNTGDIGSVLGYQAELWTTHPDSGLMAAQFGHDNGIQSVAGSLITTSATSYLPGQIAPLDLAVFNASTDDEWLTDLSLDVPPGVSVTSSTNFVGGSLGDLVSGQQVGDAARVTWHGTYGAQGYGVVRAYESAQATVTVNIAPGFSGPLVIGWTIGGDQYGGWPYQVTGQIVLAQAAPLLTIQSPNGGEVYAVGDTVAVIWSTGTMVATVDLAISRDNGATWSVLAAGVGNDGRHSLVMPAPATNVCRLRVQSVDGLIADQTDAPFRLHQRPAWAEVTPHAGALSTGQFRDLSVGVNALGLPPGVHRAWLVVWHTAATGRLVVPLTVDVSPAVSPVPATRNFAVHAAFPNPFNPRTTVAFSLPKTAVTTLDILDPRGLLVRQLFQGVLAAGDHQRQWDGRDNAGQFVSAGVYFVRVRTPAHTGTAKVTLIK